MARFRRIPVAESFDLGASLFAVAGPGGSTSGSSSGLHRRATRNPTGVAQLLLQRRNGVIEAEAWGPGADAELETVPRLLGLDDDPSATQAPPGALRELSRRFGGMHLGSTGRIFEALAPTILGQRVTSREAKRSFHRVVRALGGPAPGPPGLRVPPLPEQLAALDYEQLHRFGIERSRALILIEAARRAGRLEEVLQMDRNAAYTRLTAIRGIGAWTAGHVMGVAWGDRDAVPVGDFHLPDSVAWVLAGEPRADDARMLELLEPYRPRRRAVVLMIKRAHISAPRYGPRTPVHDIRGH